MGDGYGTIREQGVASALLPGNQSLRASVRALDTKGSKRKHGKWRARPLDHRECLLPLVWRLGNVPKLEAGYLRASEEVLTLQEPDGWTEGLG